jgi:hypothetical protein
MTRKVYKSAMGRDVDLGALLLRNEDTRAVGNMNVNARGDVLDGANKVIDQKNRLTQRQYRRTATNVTASAQVQTSTKAAKQASKEATMAKDVEELDFELDTTEILANVETQDIVEAPTPVDPVIIPPTGAGGLAAAIARSRLIKQEKEKTLREKSREQPIKRI